MVDLNRLSVIFIIFFFLLLKIEDSIQMSSKVWNVSKWEIYGKYEKCLDENCNISSVLRLCDLPIILKIPKSTSREERIKKFFLKRRLHFSLYMECFQNIFACFFHTRYSWDINIMDISIIPRHIETARSNLHILYLCDSVYTSVTALKRTLLLKILD